MRLCSFYELAGRLLPRNQISKTTGRGASIEDESVSLLPDMPAT
jgi:hypothetical protein